jgi:ABC-type lipoprotein export system ATPase subunit
LPSELSGGERQRVALCAAIAHRPALLLADEPTGELDGSNAATVRALIAELARIHGASVVLVSHDAAAAELTDRAVRIRDGRLVEDLRAAENALVVARGGWLHIPSELLVKARIGDRAHVRPVADGLIVTPATMQSGADGAGPAQPTAARLTPGVTSGVAKAADGRRWNPARIELRSISRARGRDAERRQVLDGLALALEPGRMTAVTGRSGAGKTTLLRLLCGLDRPDSGELLLDGELIDHSDPEQLAALRRARIGYLPQEPWPVGFLSAQENVVLALRLRGWDATAAAERAAAVLARVGLADRARQRVSRLSAGEGQRVALARALASARGLLIVDEPTSRLDEANAGVVAELLVAAAAEDGQTVVCATHDPEVIRRADEIVAL